METVMDMQGVSVRIGTQAILTDITAQLPKGCIIGLLGPSGAGKTTLIRVLLGLQKPTSGTVRVLDLPAGASALKSQVGYVTQTPAVYGDLTVWENVQYFGRMVGAGEGELVATLTQVELDAQRDQLVGDLSGGQRARVSLAVALLGKPQVLLLDEPTVGLDPVLRQKLWSMFRELADGGVTIVVSSHVMDEAERCDYLLFMREGRLLIADTKQAVLDKTKTSAMEVAFLQLATRGAA